jgi:hypothetical protein
MLPTRLLIDQMPKIRPTSVIPALNFWATYNDRNGKISAPPRRSMKVDMTRILKGLGKEKYCDLSLFINHPSSLLDRQEIIPVIIDEPSKKCVRYNQ